MSHDYHASPLGHRIAYRHQPGEGVGVVFLHGYRSDMGGTKSEALAAHCAAHGVPFLAFDAYAHGASEGDFHRFTIGAAIADTLEMLDHHAPREVVLVGSSMGGWVALQAALQRPLQVRGLVGVAAAPDFTERLMLKSLPAAGRRQLEDEGVIYLEDFDGNEYPLTAEFFAEARRQLLLEHPIPLSIPVHLLQGQRDADVPWETALAVAAQLTGDQVQVTLVKDGDHRLSRPQDLSLLMETVMRVR